MGWARRKFGNPDKNQPDILAFARNRLGVRKDSAVVTTGVGGGFPDTVLGFHGLTVLVEVKGKDGKLSPSQVAFMAAWDGGPVLVVDSAEDLFHQLIDLDRAVPPVRGLPADWRAEVERRVTESAAAESTAGKAE